MKVQTVVAIDKKRFDTILMGKAEKYDAALKQAEVVNVTDEDAAEIVLLCERPVAGVFTEITLSKKEVQDLILDSVKAEHSIKGSVHIVVDLVERTARITFSDGVK